MSYFTEEERKEHLIHNCEFFQFESCVDLSKGVTIRAIHYELDYILKNKPEALASDSVRFGIWWNNNFHKKLNGFSGIDCVKFTLVV